MAEGLKDVADRLVRLRLALGYENQAEFCRELRIAKNVYNPFEKARRLLTIGAALKIRRRFGIPLDWLYSGDPAALPANIYRKLGREAA